MTVEKAEIKFSQIHFVITFKQINKKPTQNNVTHRCEIPALLISSQPLKPRFNP